MRASAGTAADARMRTRGATPPTAKFDPPRGPLVLFAAPFRLGPTPPDLR